MPDNSTLAAGHTTRTEPDNPDNPDSDAASKAGQAGHTPIGVSGLSGRSGCPAVRPADLGSETPEAYAARMAHAARWRQDEARRVAAMDGATDPAECVRRLVAAGELSERAGATLLSVLR